MSEQKYKSECCNAEVDFRGGGYEGEYIHPIEEYCKKCGKLLKINGHNIDN